MIEVDPSSIDGTWRLAHDEAPEIGALIEFRAGQAFEEGKPIGPYAIDGTRLTFTIREEEEGGQKVTRDYLFKLPGPLADPDAPSLLTRELVRPEYITGTATVTHVAGFGDDFVHSGEMLVLIRIN